MKSMSERFESAIRQSDVVNKMIKSAQNMLRAIEDENKLLDQGKSSELQAAVQKKMEMLAEFNYAHSDLSEYKRIHKFDLTDPKIEKLKEVLNKIHHENKRNEFLLKVGMEVSEKIISFYKEGQIKKAIGRAGYSKDGKMNTSKDLARAMSTMGIGNKV